MATGKKTKQAGRSDKQRSQAVVDEVRRTEAMVINSLKKYGEPTMSLEELREVLSRELKGISLSDLIIKERKAGY